MGRSQTGTVCENLLKERNFFVFVLFIVFFRHVLTYGGFLCSKSAMAARWNNNGDLLFVLRRRSKPSLHHVIKLNGEEERN